MNFSDGWYANMMAEKRVRDEKVLAGYDMERGRADMEQVREALDDEGISWWDESDTTYMVTSFELPERESAWCMAVSNGAQCKIPLGTVEVELFYGEDDRGRTFMGVDDFTDKVRNHDWDLDWEP